MPEKTPWPPLMFPSQKPRQRAGLLRRHALPSQTSEGKACFCGARGAVRRVAARFRKRLLDARAAFFHQFPVQDAQCLGQTAPLDAQKQMVVKRLKAARPDARGAQRVHRRAAQRHRVGSEHGQQRRAALQRAPAQAGDARPAAGGDARAGPLRMKAVFQRRGDAGAHHRQETVRMQHLRAHAGQQAHLPVAQRRHAANVFHQPRIGGLQAVHVRPVLIEAGPHRRRHQRAGDVRTAAREGAHVSPRRRSRKTRG